MILMKTLPLGQRAGTSAKRRGLAMEMRELTPNPDAIALGVIPVIRGNYRRYETLTVFFLMWHIRKKMFSR